MSERVYFVEVGGAKMVFQSLGDARKCYDSFSTDHVGRKSIWPSDESSW